jgi:glycosyltransferase involved in cell wall biosynthesis
MISVITPVFNGERFIEFCIRNVIEQNCRYAEHVIVDGCSTDGTVEIVRQFAENYPHIRWISEKDRGQSDAMNKGIAMARGEIVGFLNVDDYYEPGVLGKVAAMFERLPEPSLLVGTCNVWDNEGNLWFVSRPSKISLANLMLERFMEAFPMNSSAYFYHASLHRNIGLYNVDEHFGMDLDFIMRAVQVAHVTFVDEIWGNYRYLEGTKTFRDIKSGNSLLRSKSIVNSYRRKLPWAQQVKIRLLCVMFRNSEIWIRCATKIEGILRGTR